MKSDMHQIILIGFLTVGFSYVMLTILRLIFMEITGMLKLAMWFIGPILSLFSKRLCKKIADRDIRLQKLFDICLDFNVNITVGVDTSRVIRSSGDGKLDTIVLENSCFGSKKDIDYMIVVFAHELGHLLWDRENDYEISTNRNPSIKDLYDYEVAAWDRADKLLTDHKIKHELFDDLKAVSLKTYADAVFAQVQSNAVKEVVKYLEAEKVIKLAEKTEELFYDRDL
jgi:hypothetical protein